MKLLNPKSLNQIKDFDWLSQNGNEVIDRAPHFLDKMKACVSYAVVKQYYRFQFQKNA